MKLPQLYAELSNKTEYGLTPIIDVIKDLDIKSIEHVFKKELHAWMCAALEQIVYFTSELSISVTTYIHEGKIIFNADYRKDVGFYNYQQVVLHELQLLYDSKSLDYSLTQKAAVFESYLHLNKQRFKELDTLIRMNKMKGIYKDCREIANLTMKKPFIDIAELNTQLQRLFYYTDRNYLLKLLHPTNYQDYINREQKGVKEFNYNYYKNPPIYEADPKEKEIYLRFLKAWILENIENRKTILNWRSLPEEYKKLKFYAVSLLPSVDINTTINMPLEHTKQETVEVLEYPSHIFPNYQTFQLFKLLMESFNTHSTVSFVYRMMSEKENPALIVVKDTPFRDWFNQQSYNLQLETFTKTFENVKNDDRIALYKLAKSMIFNKS